MCLGAFHTEGTLVGQLYLKQTVQDVLGYSGDRDALLEWLDLNLVWVGVSQGTLHRGCPGGVSGTKAGTG